MRINHNIAALNTHRQLSQANSANQSSMEKLSSGLRINRAGDDAAGLAISEKMRGQIRGLEQAERNAQDGISMIQTAEGALNETHSILQRMRELSVQASNDTNTNTDRFELQKEINQLTEEISRIGESTEFNTKSLLDGSFSGEFQIGANEGQSITLDIGDMDSESLNVTTDTAVAVTDGGSTNMTASSGFDKLVGGSYSIEVASDGSASLLDSDGNEISTAAALADNASSTSFTLASSSAYVAGDSSATVSISISDTDTSSSFATDAGTISANVLEKGEGISVMTQDDAESAISSVQNALDRVSAERSKLGAYQNRLDHSINNLGTSAENLTAAESRIRDVDMAKEMMAQTKSSILAQASQSMLAKANQQPQGVLQLLR